MKAQALSFDLSKWRKRLYGKLLYLDARHWATKGVPHV
ncbi:hypothetical protein MPLB_1490047 [Mesorhizobium sp. ORS 3324]|nr:hypothetical protein MPLB_1490047 [Mesorhizobium sp. ORS 3324]